jgi:hypothetical protein
MAQQIILIAALILVVYALLHTPGGGSGHEKPGANDKNKKGGH